MNFPRAEKSLLTQIFYYRQGKAKSFTRTGQISCDDVLSVVNGFETLLLDGEKSCDTLLLQILDSLSSKLWVFAEVTVFVLGLGATHDCSSVGLTLLGFSLAVD